MFGERLKRIVAIILIFGMVATGNGFTTFAASVDSIVEGSDTLDQTGPKNYYQMMYEEYYQETTTVVETTAPSDNAINVIESEAGKVDPGQALATTEKKGSEDSDSTEPQSFDEEKEYEYEEEPE